jgi:hypothetical protein
MAASESRTGRKLYSRRQLSQKPLGWAKVQSLKLKDLRAEPEECNRDFANGCIVSALPTLRAAIPGAKLFCSWEQNALSRKHSTKFLEIDPHVSKPLHLRRFKEVFPATMRNSEDSKRRGCWMQRAARICETNCNLSVDGYITHRCEIR